MPLGLLISNSILLENIILFFLVSIGECIKAFASLCSEIVEGWEMTRTIEMQ